MKSHCTVQNCKLGTVFQDLEEKLAEAPVKTNPGKPLANLMLDLHILASFYFDYLLV